MFKFINRIFSGESYGKRELLKKKKNTRTKEIVDQTIALFKFMDEVISNQKNQLSGLEDQKSHLIVEKRMLTSRVLELENLNGQLNDQIKLKDKQIEGMTKALSGVPTNHTEEVIS